MTKESGLWRTVKSHLSPFGELRRIENGVGTGEGDVVYCLTSPKPGSLPATGWLELKSGADYPVRPMTPLRAPHLTIEQVQFAEDWSAAGGRAWLLLKSPPWFLLFDPPGTRGLYELKVAAADGPAVAKVAGMGKFPLGRVLRALTQDIKDS